MKPIVQEWYDEYLRRGGDQTKPQFVRSCAALERLYVPYCVDGVGDGKAAWAKFVRAVEKIGGDASEASYIFAAIDAITPIS